MEKLSAYLDSQGHGSRAELARHCGVHPTTVSRWQSGERVPDRRSMLAIQAFTNGAVPVTVWFAAEDSAA